MRITFQVPGTSLNSVEAICPPPVGAGRRDHGVSEGERLTLRNVVLTVLHTPGHTPEHISLTIVDATRGEARWDVLPGTR